MSLYIKTDGTQSEVYPNNGVEYTLEELHKFVDGYVEIVRIADKKMIVLDEEGKLKGKPVNFRATVLADSYIAANDVIVGDVLVINDGEIS